jgi:hypothetical protein
MDREPHKSASTGSSTIIVLNRDLFFGVRIGNLLKSAGYAPFFAKSTGEFVDLLQSADVPPVLAIIDLGAAPDWNAIRSLSDDTPILAFGPHKDVEALRAARSAGVSRVVSNSEFHKNALSLVERYARRPE